MERPALPSETVWLVLLVALALDLTVGDPPNRYHPVAWMGSMIARARRLAPQDGRWAPCIAGAVLVIGGVVVWGAVGWLLERGFATLPWPLRWLAEAGVLKTTFALRGLVRASQQVQTALDAGNLLHAGTCELASGESRDFPAHRLAGGCRYRRVGGGKHPDGIVAPWFFYVLGGLPAAFAYRFINTADAMLGYRDPQREWLGKIPARRMIWSTLSRRVSRLSACCWLPCSQGQMRIRPGRSGVAMPAPCEPQCGPSHERDGRCPASRADQGGSLSTWCRSGPTCGQRYYAGGARCIGPWRWRLWS